MTAFTTASRIASRTGVSPSLQIHFPLNLSLLQPKQEIHPVYFSSLYRSNLIVYAPASAAPLAASDTSVSVFQPFLGLAFTLTLPMPKGRGFLLQPPLLGYFQVLHDVHKRRLIAGSRVSHGTYVFIKMQASLIPCLVCSLRRCRLCRDVSCISDNPTA